MTLNLDTLRKIAEAATPGPWEWEEPSKYDWPTEDESLVQSDGNEVVLSGWGYDASGTEAEDVDRAHIAAFDPPTVLALLSRLEQAEQLARINNQAMLAQAQRAGQAEQAVLRVREALTEVQTRGEKIRAKGNNGSIYQQERAARGEGYLEATRLAFRALDGDTRG